jgi:hypothetical protein
METGRLISEATEEELRNEMRERRIAMEKETIEFPLTELIAFLEERGFSVAGIKVDNYPAGVPCKPYIDFTVCYSRSGGPLFTVH